MRTEKQNLCIHIISSNPQIRIVIPIIQMRMLGLRNGESVLLGKTVFIQERKIKSLLQARHCSRCWNSMNKTDKVFVGSCLLDMEDTITKYTT